MAVLFFWKGDNYTRDMANGPEYHLNQDSSRMASLRPGDHVWAFTRREDKTYVLAADLVVVGVSKNRPGADGAEYGKNHVDGDRRSSRYFDVSVGPDVEPAIRGMGFDPKDRALGSGFQGLAAVKPLPAHHERILRSFASGLPTI